ncbi:MAG TPA: FHA domain-containing protein [Albitalea sp.]|nr:FHA domain-containing protein [Albitalea sp.]
MSIKSWVLDRVHRMNALVARVDLPARDSALDTASEPAPRARRIEPQGPDSVLSNAEHLGAYGALISAIRDELEHFVASHVRLHLAIADRDRFLLTSIGVRCPGAGEARQLLQLFMHEFKPEQVKRYLAREVIGGLPNAAAIDLSQFAGLFDADARDDAEEGGEYRDLLDALESTPLSPALRPYQVSVLGRWSELDVARPAAAPAYPGATPSTPLAGQRCEFDIEDGDGKRRVVLQAVVPGRRYVVGKGESCDIRVNGTYTSRRHAEIWLDNGAWWVTDAGSTNGIRVESPAGVHDRSGPSTAATTVEQPIRLMEGARIVLSARAEGPASDYPCVAMRPPAGAASRITPIASTVGAPKTPLTAILPAGSVLKLTASMVAGVRTLELRPGALPVKVGRSRNQTLVIDRRHEGVSGHHLDITELDESGAQVAVHGDNGVLVDGVARAMGTRFRWKVGETMVLGASPDDHPTCTLTLTRGNG